MEREDGRFAVETATSAGEGLDRLADEDFDCVVSDYEMPGKSGIEFLETVREDAPELPFILFTGKGSEEIASDAISAGVTDYLQKRRGTDQYAILANRIRNAVERTRAERDRERIRERMELALTETDSVIFEFDFETGEVSRHGAVEDFFDVPPDRISTKSDYVERVVHPDDRDRFREFYERLRSSDREYDVIDYRTDPGTGRVRWFRDYANVSGGDGGPARAIGLAQDITDQRQQERALRRKERRYEAIFDNTHTFVGLLEPDGTVLEANETALDFGGLERAEIVGKPLWETALIGSDEGTRSTVREAVEQARDGDLFRDEIRIQGADREAVIDFSVRPITDERGEVTLLVPEGRDITEREEQARKRERIIDRVTDAIVEVDADWRFTLVNQRAEELYDMDEAELLGRDFWEVFDAARDTRFEEEYRYVMETREPTSFVEYYAGLDGWFDVEAYPNDDGGVSFYFREVSGRVNRSRELERRNERFQYVEAVADIGYWEIDPRTPWPHDVTLSDGVYDVYDLSPDEPFDVGRGIRFYHPDDRPEVRRNVERAISNGEPYDHEARLVTAAGRERWVHSVGEPIERDGEVVKVRGVFQDITDRKRHEEALARQNERLEEFASIVSHDLRNPLDVADGRLELARDDCDSEHLDHVANALDRSQALVDDLLTLARQGEELGDVEPIALADVVEDCWRNVETEGATLEVDSTRTVVADRGRLRQLLENLVRNAVDHGDPSNRTRSGETANRGSTGDRPGPDDAVESTGSVTVTVGGTDGGFYVADDGPGIPADERDRVFETGYSTAADGTGLGLAVVERIAEAHGWEVGVRGSDGGGARFEITGVSAEPNA